VKNPTSRRSWGIAAVVLLAWLAGGLITNSSAQGRGEEKVSDLPHFAPGSLFEPQSNYVLTPDIGKRAHSRKVGKIADFLFSPALGRRIRDEAPGEAGEQHPRCDTPQPS